MTDRFPSLHVATREVKGNLRRPGAFVCLILIIGACLLVIRTVWPDESIPFSAIAPLSRNLFVFLTAILWASAYLFVPGVAAGAITLEHESGTYDELRLTLVRPSGLVAAKFSGAILFFLLLVVGALPVLGAVLFLVGQDARDFLVLVGVIVTAAAACAAVGLLCSALVRRTATATVLAYVAVVLVASAPGFVLAVFDFLFFGLDEVLMGWLCPSVAFVRYLDEITPPTGLLGVLVYQAVVAVFAYLLALKALRRPPAPPRMPKGKIIDDQEQLLARRRQFPYYLLDPLRRKDLIDDHVNPMLAKEVRWGTATRETTLIRATYVLTLTFIALAGYLGLQSAYDLNLAEGIQYWTLLQIGIAILAAPPLVSNALTKEHELGNIDMLRMTLLRSDDIILGKLVAAMVGTVPILTASLAGGAIFLILAIILGKGGSALFIGYVSFFVCLFVALSTVLVASSRCRRTGAAIVFSYLMEFVVFFGFCMAMGLVWYLMDPHRFASWSDIRMLSLLSPITGYLYAINTWRLTGQLDYATYSRWQAEGYTDAFPFGYWFFDMCAFLSLALIGILWCMKTYGHRDR